MNKEDEAKSIVVDLSAWAKESQRRGELIEVYLVNRATEEVIYTSTNPHFIAGVIKVGAIAPYKLVTR